MIPNGNFYSMSNMTIMAMARMLRMELYEQPVACSLIQIAGTEGGLMGSMTKKVIGNYTRMSPEMKQIYGKGGVMLMMEAAAKNPDGKHGGYDPKWAFDSVYHATSSRYPKTRYSTTPMGTVLWFITFLFPDRLLDAFMFKGPAGNKHFPLEENKKEE